MSLLKDFIDDSKCYRFRYRVQLFFSPRAWLRLHKWRKQRANRGWSDADTWNAGDHIARITADMLEYLKDNSITDWQMWFEMNVKENEGYKDLQSVINDIRSYLDFQFTDWAEDLVPAGSLSDSLVDSDEDGYKEYICLGWVNKETGKKVSERQVAARIKKHCKEERRRYKKAQEAMRFFGRHFSGFWD